MSFINVEIKQFALNGKKADKSLASALAHKMDLHVQETFDQEGPGWTPLKAKTRRQRVAQGFGAGPILDRKRVTEGGSLRTNIISSYTEDQAIVGVKAGIKYAKIHQFGGIINRVVKAGMVRLRTTRSGKLMRQEKYPKLSVFARTKGKSAHKMFKPVNYEGGKNYQIVIPQRKYLFFNDKLISDLKKTVIDFLNK